VAHHPRAPVAATLPPDVEVSDVPIDRPALVEAIELAIGLIPVVGSVVAAYEAWSGEDLFGYQLSDVERGSLAASVLLPTAGRLVKGGRALYTEARLVSLYGRDAASWSRATGAAARGLAERQALETVERAERALRVQRSVTGALRTEAATAVPALTKGATTLTTSVDREVLDFFRELSATHRELRSLDALAMERVLAKGPNVDHLKGQLLEELIESRLVPWLSTREGGFALGIAVPAGQAVRVRMSPTKTKFLRRPAARRRRRDDRAPAQRQRLRVRDSQGRHQVVDPQGDRRQAQAARRQAGRGGAVRSRSTLRREAAANQVRRAIR
jgi:hypothetical protein